MPAVATDYSFWGVGGWALMEEATAIACLLPAHTFTALPVRPITVWYSGKFLIPDGLPAVVMTEGRCSTVIPVHS